MIRISHALVLLMAVWCAGLLVWTSQSVQKTERELSQVQRQQLAEVEAARVLMSEWEYLNRPERLETLISDYQFETNKENAEKKILLSLNEIKNPIIPAVPKAKPDSLLRRASMGSSAQRVVPIVKAPSVQNSEDKFGSVINGLLNDDEGAR